MSVILAILDTGVFYLVIGDIVRHRETRSYQAGRVGRRIWSSLAHGPLGPIVPTRISVATLGEVARGRVLTFENVYECPLCIEPKNILYATPCLHIFCEMFVQQAFRVFPSD